LTGGEGVKKLGVASLGDATGREISKDVLLRGLP